MKKYRIVLLAMVALALAGCSSNKTSEEKTQYMSSGGLVNIYIPDSKNIRCRDEQYQIKQLDSVNASVEEIMSVLKDELADKAEYVTYIIDEDNNLTLNFKATDISKEDRLLFDAAVTETLFQIQDIKSITIAFYDEDGELISKQKYESESMYFYGDNGAGDNVRKASVYVSSDKEKLEKYYVNFYVEFDKSIEERIVDYISEHGEIPDSSAVNNVAIVGNICYLDMNSYFATASETTDPVLSIYSIVNSITSLDGIDYVQFLIDGENVEMYRKTVDISEPLGFNSDIVVE